ncbi:hypothetical protein Goklo_019801, partial [Gossypium klotzschianum]|nr:hypothetical protein [Gossypium klotzschianum]
MPIFHKRVTLNTFQFVVDTVRSNLNGRDARRLSMAARKPALVSWNDCCKLVDLGVSESAVLLVWSEVKSGITWVIGDGGLINLWNNEWLTDIGPLRYIYSRYEQLDETLLLANMVTSQGSSDWQKLKSLLPLSIVDKISGLIPLAIDGGPDQLVWKWMSGGRFSTVATYNHLVVRRSGASGRLDTDMWKVEAPQRVRNFLWLFSRSSLLTNKARCRTGMSDDNHCGRCEGAIETTLAVRDCIFPSGVWKSIIPCDLWEFFAFPLQDWLRWNIQNAGHIDSEGEGATLFSIICWLLWKIGNDFVFNFMSSSSSEIIGTGVAWDRSFTNARLKTNLACSSSHGIGWQQAAAGWINLSVDGSFAYHLSQASIGGVIRDSTGEWLLGFSMKVAGSDVFQVEARAIYEGIKLAWNRGFRCVEVNSDNASSFAEATIEGNRVADGLAKVTLDDSQQQQIFLTPPHSICSLYMDDLGWIGSNLQTPTSDYSSSDKGRKKREEK